MRASALGLTSTVAKLLALGADIAAKDAVLDNVCFSLFQFFFFPLPGFFFFFQFFFPSSRPFFSEMFFFGTYVYICMYVCMYIWLSDILLILSLYYIIQIYQKYCFFSSDLTHNKSNIFLFCFMSFIILYTHVNALNVSIYIYMYHTRTHTHAHTHVWVCRV